jgi:hypothetical protein
MDIENVVYKGAANHFVGIEGVGGKLYLTSEALIFISHSLNIQRHQMNIPLADIAELEKGNSLGLIPNRLIVHTTAGTHEKFVINNRNVWIEKINSLRGI